MARAQERDYARFYDVDEETSYPSVTTVLDVINKPALGPWYAKVEREALLGALGDALKAKKRVTRAKLIALVEELAREKKAADRQKDRAANIGNQAHALVENEIRRRLGLTAKRAAAPVSPEALACFESWTKWFAGTGLTPIAAEQTLWCHGCGFAGTADLIAEKNGKVYVLDWKTGKAIYDEAYLQNVAYQHAATYLGTKNVAGGAVVRLPKEGGAVEAVMTPKVVRFETFRAALSLWRALRLLKGQAVGDAPKEQH